METCGLSAAGATASRRCTATRTWRCWGAGVKRTRRSADRPRRRSCSASAMTSATSAMIGWRGSRWLKSIVCARVRGTGSSGWSTSVRAVQVAIGQRRAPQPEGRPGYLRADTVHQGDRDGVKGVYHINAVDEVTQWEVVSATAQISEAALKPVLEALLRQFPFR